MLAAVDDESGSPRQYLLDLPGGAQIFADLERKLLGYQRPKNDASGTSAPVVDVVSHGLIKKSLVG